MAERAYIAIDLKSFYASVECVERQLDPLTTNLVVADASRTNKTICLAVSPALKSRGVPGRPRLFEVVEIVERLNAERVRNAPRRAFTGSSFSDPELRAHPELRVDYLVATPRMALYMHYSRRIYEIYLRYVAPEDIHVYSVDEVFMDVTRYLKTYGLTPREMAAKLLREVIRETGITGTAGIGTNLYLCKVAMDIVAKHMPADAEGVRIAELDEMRYRRERWTHRPLTDFWRVGPGYARKLADHGLYTMGDIARCSLGKSGDFHNEDLLYRLFGVNAELLIDHAWGWESCTIAEIKAYKPEVNSLGSGQVLHEPYPWEKARLIVQEMIDQLMLDLVDKGLVTDQLGLYIGYDTQSLADPAVRQAYHGEICVDHYGRSVPKYAQGTTRLERWTSSSRLAMEAILALYDRVIDKRLLVRRVNVVAARVMDEKTVRATARGEQMDLFTDYAALAARRAREEEELAREHSAQKALLAIKRKYGKNAIVKGMNLQEGATSMDRNRQIGGHKA